MKRICIINCWFGPYHNYFGLWMKSVAWNPTIDFLIVGDTPLPDGAPSNLRHLPMTLEELEAKIRRRLGNEKAILPSPYKCCDYKAMYGTIFGEELSGYDFWGHCDIDLVFGDLRDFLTEERLSRYDKIYPNGHLSVFRNNQEVNERWRLPYAKFDVEQVIASPMNFAFDEWDGIYNIYIRLGLPFLRDVEFLNLAPGTRRFRFRRRTNAKYERPPENHDHQCFYWENGKVHRAFIDADGEVQVEDYAYIHFFKRKFSSPDEETLDHSAPFYCTPRGFAVKKTHGVPSPEDVKRNNPYLGRAFEWLEDKWLKCRRRFNHIAGKSSFAPKSMRIPGSSWNPNN